MTKHLHDMTLDELEQVVCMDCGKNNIDYNACQNSMQDNEPVCVDCCKCPNCEDN